MLFSIHKVLYSITTQHQYIVNNTKFWLQVYGFIKPSSGKYLSYEGTFNVWGHAVAQFVEALLYKSECRCFVSRLCHCNFSLT